MKHPELRAEFTATIPKPDLEAIKKNLDKLQRDYGKAFPNTRYGSSYDNYAYNRVRGPLAKFKASNLTSNVLGLCITIDRLRYWSKLKYCRKLVHGLLLFSIL